MGDKVQVKTTVRPGKWKWLPGLIIKKCGALTYLVRVGNCTRFCRIDHLLTCQADLLEERTIINDAININPALQTKYDEESRKKEIQPIEDLTSGIPSAENIPSTVDSPLQSSGGLSSIIAPEKNVFLCNLSNLFPFERKPTRRLIAEM